MASTYLTLIYKANKLQPYLKDVYMETIKCKVCEKPFLNRRYDRPSKYCSRACFSVRNPKVKKQCCICKKEFSHWKSERPNAEFCSKKCSGPVVARRYSSRLTNRSMEEKIDSLKIKFYKKIIKTEGCWEWTGLKQSVQPYGLMVGIDNTLMRAHRISYLIHKGAIPKDLFVLHKCDNPPCVNPDHLFVGTQKDNVQDMINKGRAKCKKKGERWLQT